MVCEDAVRIATALETPEAIKEWHGLDWDAQKAAVPELSDGHSGNSFGAACRFAMLYLTFPPSPPQTAKRPD